MARTVTRKVSFRTTAQVEKLIGTVAHHTLTDGTTVRARIEGRAFRNYQYLEARIVDGPLEGRTVVLGGTAKLEVA